MVPGNKMRRYSFIVCSEKLHTNAPSLAITVVSNKTYMCIQLQWSCVGICRFAEQSSQTDRAREGRSHQQEHWRVLSGPVQGDQLCVCKYSCAHACVRACVRAYWIAVSRVCALCTTRARICTLGIEYAHMRACALCAPCVNLCIVRTDNALREHAHVRVLVIVRLFRTLRI